LELGEIPPQLDEEEDKCRNMIGLQVDIGLKPFETLNECCLDGHRKSVGMEKITLANNIFVIQCH
jgi:hypothetical protein